MYFYKFNISDYLSHTAHLSEIEDLAYRRMLDWYYLHEKPLPKDVDLIAKNIRMRSYNECITNVLREFFIDTENGFENNRANSEIITYCEKSEKAKASIKSRWDKNKNKNKELPDCTNVLRTKYERNTKQETLNTKQEAIKIPYQLIADAYNDHFAKKTGNASVKSDSLSDKRKKAIKRMWLSEKTFQELESWIKYFSHCADLPNMQFDAPRSEKWATWKPSFDYLLKQDALEKAREGRL